MKPLISIVTPSYNQGSYIEETLESVLNQAYPHIEYIVIDGGSSDSTGLILDAYKNRLSYCVSELDNGQASALNKGFTIASGSIMAYINSDDLLLPGALEKVSQFFIENPETQWVATASLVGSDLDHANIWLPMVDNLEKFLAGQSFPQQGVFWKADILPKPWFDEQFNFIMDADFFARLVRVAGLPSIMPEITSFFRIHSEAKSARISHVMASEAPALLRKHSDIYSVTTITRICQTNAYGNFLTAQKYLRSCSRTDALSVRALTIWKESFSYLGRSGFRNVIHGVLVLAKSLVLATKSILKIRRCLNPDVVTRNI